MFETLLGILPLVEDAYKWIVNRNEQEREKFASICERISNLLESFANASDNERKSRNLCEELRVYVPEIKKMAEGILEENQLNSMAEALDGVCDAWAKHSESLKQSSYESDSDLGEIDAAAGHFRALANLVQKL